MLFDPRAHEPLLEAGWRPGEAEAAIRVIARDADDALRGREWWPVHPLDMEEGDPDFFHGIYLGAAGMVWALDRLARAGLHEPGHDYARLASEVFESYPGGDEQSFWMGEAGVALVAWLLSPRPDLADRIAALIGVEPEDDTLELLWGSPGLLLIADAMLERAPDEHWASAWSAIAERLMRRRGADVPDFWTQRLYGFSGQIIGAAHGLAGIVAALARRPGLLPPAELARGATAALAASAIREGDRANWPPSLQDDLYKADGSIRVQWCHGAPGIVTSLAGLPPEDELESLLLAGGELTWAAGPLGKGASLCHGTAGNGFAFLKLFTLTGDESWLRRARRFAMHAAAQVESARRAHGQGRHSLWTGDIGTALYLEQCLAATSDVPTIDSW